MTSSHKSDVKPKAVEVNLRETTAPLARADSLPRPPLPAPASPPQIRGYRLLRERPISSGGMGVVYKFLEEASGEIVAIKVPRVTALAGPADQSGRLADEVLRFEREVQRLRGLRHPSVVRFRGSGSCRWMGVEVPYLVMEFVRDAKPITTYARGMSVRRRLELFRKACGAVRYLHAMGIIHRDLKPANILVNKQGRVKLIDLGIATLSEWKKATIELEEEFGRPIGTLVYMSPEQLEGDVEYDPDQIDIQTDVYALGVVLYELLCGRTPYPLNHILERQIRDDILSDHRERIEAPSQLNPRLGGDLERVMLRALERYPENRFKTVGTLSALRVGRRKRERDERRARNGDLLCAVECVLADLPLPEPDRSGTSRRLRHHGRRWIRRHAWLAHTAAAVIAAVLGYGLFNLLDVRGVPLMKWWERRLAFFHPTQAASPLDSVALLTFRGFESLDPIGKEVGLAPVEKSTPKGTARRLWGALMKRLATAHPAVVIFDMELLDSSEGDQEFIAGVEALRRAGVSVVVDGTEWFAFRANGETVPDEIARHVVWGTTTADAGAARLWSLEATVQPLGEDPRPSLALAGAALHRTPPMDLSLTVDKKTDTVMIGYAPRVAEEPGATPRVPPPSSIPITSVIPSRLNTPEYGVLSGAPVGYYTLDLPSATAIAGSEIDLADFLKMDQTRASDRIKGLAVVIGNIGDPKDQHPTPDGRTLSGCVGQAVAIGQMLRKVPIRSTSSLLSDSALMLGAASLGAFVVGAGRSTGRKRRAAPAARGRVRQTGGRLIGLVALMAAAGAVAGAFLIAFAWWRVLAYPFAPMAGVLFGGGFCALVWRWRRPPAWDAEETKRGFS